MGAGDSRNMFNKILKILNPKHQTLNKFQYLNSKFKTNLSRESFTKETIIFSKGFCEAKKFVFVIGISVIWYCLGFRISNLGFNKGGGDG